ncbi:DUF309 domain-containing protein [Nocardiopsis mangrovi]|uniref:DUF309 domain-containing protein n=1 Tax=Nocardiopsis mangrovi TaxID=1179818 RepID=A0ABV9E0S2_9ACTN
MGATQEGGRDRDPSGRAQNQRPRDRLGRPLPYGSPGVPRVPDDAVFTAQEGLDAAQRFLDDGYAFHAHEVLEAVWKSAPDEQRELWRGLAQVAVGLTHAQRGNRVGGARLLRRGADRVEEYGPRAPEGVDAQGAAAFGRGVADALDRGDDAPLDTAGLRLRRGGTHPSVPGGGTPGGVR